MTHSRNEVDDPRDDVHLGRADVDEDVQVLLSPAGSAVLLPRSVSKLTGQAADAVARLQRVVVELQDLQETRDELVDAARDAGASWGAIGWSVGTSAEAARQRWGVPNMPGGDD